MSWLRWLFTFFSIEKQAKMSERLTTRGSIGPEIYDDDSEYPADIYNDTPFLHQAAFLGEGASGLISRETIVGDAIGYIQEMLFLRSISSGGGNHRFNDRIQNTSSSVLKVGALDFERPYCEVLVQARGNTTISAAAYILQDPKNLFGLGSGTDKFNFYLDTNDDLRLENTSADNYSFWALEESFDVSIFQEAF